jgi:hypothetical protein
VVVRVATPIGRPAGRASWLLLRATVMFAGITLLPTATQSASTTGPPNPAPPFSLRGRAPQIQVFDPAATRLFSLLSYGAMSVIAPTIYGDFLSPTALSSSFGSSGVGPMPESEGLDPAVSQVLGDTMQGGLPAGAGWGEAQPFGVRSSSAVDVAGTGALSGEIATVSGAGGVPPVCSDDQTAMRLQAGGEFWNAQGVSATPVQFPSGVFTGNDVGNPLGLGPSGDRSNIIPPGPAGGWCRPFPAPFSQSSPLESPILWIGIATLFVTVVVFWLSRGFKMPTRGGHFVVQALGSVRGDSSE